MLIEPLADAIPKQQQQTTDSQQHKKCGRCGYQHPEGRAKCPAVGKKCNKCGGMDHFRQMCQNDKKAAAKNVQQEEQPDNSDADNVLGMLQINDAAVTGDKKRLVEEKVAITLENGKRIVIPFLADTGANVSCIPRAMLKQFGIREKDITSRDKPPQLPLQANGKRSGLRGVGYVRAKARVRDVERPIRIAVYDGLHRALLSREACVVLGIWAYTGKRQSAFALSDNK